MKSFCITLLLTLALAGAAFAQSKITIGGVDQRVPPMESQFLAQQLAEKSQQLARAAAMLAVDGQDRKELEDRAAATQAWLDQSWREMEYWRAYAGQVPE